MYRSSNIVRLIKSRRFRWAGHLARMEYFQNFNRQTYNNIVLYGCETWSHTLREECRLRVYENRILRQIFGPKRDENGEWRRHQNELHCLYRSPNIVRVIKFRRLRWAGHVAIMEEGRSDFNFFNKYTYRKETFRKY